MSKKILTEVSLKDATKEEAEAILDNMQLFVYPTKTSIRYGARYKNLELQSFGLSKRELYASMAMQGMLANENIAKHTNKENIVKDCVELADLLINELNKEKEDEKFN